MGYEFHVSKVALSANNKLNLAVMIENRGVAPFYYAWPLEFALLDDKGRMPRLEKSQASLKGILPGDAGSVAEHAFDINGLPPGRYRVLLRVANPLEGGKPVRFANAKQDADLASWLTLGETALP
jgi:hypothetical protein